MSFEDEIKEGKVVADFYADWCGPCKKLEPAFEKLKQEYKDVKFIKVNIEDQKAIADQFGVMSIPCLIFFITFFRFLNLYFNRFCPFTITTTFQTVIIFIYHQAITFMTLHFSYSQNTLSFH